MAKRLAGRFGYPEAPHEFDVTAHYNRLSQPLRWRKPKTVFVCSMSDIFHPDVSEYMRTRVFDVMADERCEQHTFIVLTKRPEQIAEWEWWVSEYWPGNTAWNVAREVLNRWPDNIWLGVTAENQRRADERIPWLLRTPAAVRFVSVEPMLGPVNISRWAIPPGQSWAHEVALAWGEEPEPDWIICGAETGPGARSIDFAWARDLRDQCAAAGTPFFWKRAGPGQTTPPDLAAVRQWPERLRQGKHR